MSFDFNHKFWIATKKDLQKLIKQQDVLKKLEPSGDKIMTFKVFSELYVLYAELVNKMGYVYQNTFQVQKRQIVRPLMEAAMRRLIELKNELKILELSEYVYVDKALIRRKLTPYDLMVWKSPEFLYRRPADIQNILYDNKLFMDDDEKKVKDEEEHVKISEAVLLIQTHERARRARVYKAAIKYDKKYLIVREARKVSYKFTHKPDQPLSIPIKRTIFNAVFVKPDEECQYLLAVDEVDEEKEELEREELERARNEAATIIQKAYRAHKNKKLVKRRLIFKQELYGMKIKRRLIKPKAREEEILQVYKNELFKQKLDAEFLALIQNERVRLLQERSPWIMEDISDHIRGWFREFYDKTENFHPYPDVVKEGTVLVVLDETMTLMEFSDSLKAKKLTKEEKKAQMEKIRDQKKKEKQKLKKQKLKEALRRKKMKAAGVYDIGYMISSNKHIGIIEKTMKQYGIDWRAIDEYLNKTHSPIKDWVTQDELATIHKELRMLVDEYMRIEYELLRKAHCADLKKKYKPSKPKKPKKKKGKKKRKAKDMTADRTLESLYNELKDAGLIETYNIKAFHDFIAEFNFVADNLRDDDQLTTLGPSKRDIEMVVQDCMMGLGEFVCDKPKSVCLIGPLNSGKKLLCNIIASELDAVVINLSPEKTCIDHEIFDNMNYFFHVLMKVAKAFQPTILYIQDAHRVFWKKIPKGMEDLKPRFLQKYLTKKILKLIKKDDRILVLATSELPWAAKGKFKKIFQKIILLPRTDYGTSFLLWLEYLNEYAGEYAEDYEITALARVLQNYTSGDITNNIVETLDVNRRMRLKTNPLDPREFLEHFIGGETPQFPPELKIMEKYDKWFSKSNKMSKLRRNFMKLKEGKNKNKKK